MMNNRFIFQMMVMISLLIPLSDAVAYNAAGPLTDREIVERLIRLEEGQKSIREEMRAGFQAIDQRFQDMDKRFQAIDQRFEDMDKRLQTIEYRFQSIDQRFQSIDLRFQSLDQRFESIDQRFDQVVNLLIGIVTAFAGLVAVMISFAIWDRRTMVRPFEKKVQEIEAEIGSNRQKLHSLLDALRLLAQEDSKLAEVLKSFALL